MTEGNRRAILAALLANAGIAVAKLFAWMVTGAASLLAESIHSLADVTNQSLLILGGARAAREPTPEQWKEGELWRPVVSELGQRLLLRAYRRPPLPAEIDRLSELVDRSRQNGDSFPRAMQLALQTVLVSPNPKSWAFFRDVIA